ncbi:MAG: HD domain-containing protein [Myxococcota bacterium]|nr:HD domain-containing protein [Myxococcota bacterium]
MFAPDLYVAALRFAAARHGTQMVPGTELPYVVHITSVAAEVIAVGLGDLAVTCALLHDVVEDTAKTDAERADVTAQISELFGADVAAGVLALTKSDAIPKKADRMTDSLCRIREQPHDVWAVKLADRITNLAPPPASWNPEKIAAYRIEAIAIADALGDANAALHARLRAKIEAYGSR